MKTVTLDEWKKEAESIFGEGSNVKTWQFKCVSCGQSQTLQEFIDAKIENADTRFYYSCIGRYVKGRGCDWTLGGLLTIHTKEVISQEGKPIPVFEFFQPVVQEEM